VVWADRPTGNLKAAAKSNAATKRFRTVDLTPVSPSDSDYPIQII
jgi:hypothetical protein